MESPRKPKNKHVCVCGLMNEFTARPKHKHRAREWKEKKEEMRHNSTFNKILADYSSIWRKLYVVASSMDLLHRSYFSINFVSDVFHAIPHEK